MRKTVYQNILDAAMDLFYSRGYEATSMADIAKECGCTKQALSYHFGTKEALGKAVCLRYIQDLSEGFFRIVSSADSTPDTEERIVAGLAYLLWSGAPFYSQDAKAFRFYREFIYKYPDLSTLQSEVCSMYISFFRYFSADTSDLHITMCAQKALYAAHGILYKYIIGDIPCSLDEFQYFYYTVFMGDIITDKTLLDSLYHKAQKLIDAHSFHILPDYRVE